MIVNRFDRAGSAETGFFGVGHQVLETGSFDPQQLHAMKQLVGTRRKFHGDGVVVIDGGANIGTHACALSKAMNGWGRVIAFEVQSMVYYALCGNICLNNCFNIVAKQIALGATNGTIDVPHINYSTHSSFGSLELKRHARTENIGQEVDYKKTYSVPMCTIDSLNLPRLDFLKLDIEGMEIEALEGAGETIRKCKPIVWIEFIKTDVNLLTDRLRNLGYDNCVKVGLDLVAIHRDDPAAADVRFVP
jgi:FkbM family methyltransferase